jgi:hypothetical protein
VNRLVGTDVVTGEPATSAGHLFLAIPCLDAGGLPVEEACAHDVGSRSWTACTASGCHGNATAAVSAFSLSAQRLDQLTDQIWEDRNGNDAIDPDSTACSNLVLPCANPTGSTATDDANRANWDAGLLARTDIIANTGPGSQYITNDNTITPAEGARFNVRMLREGGADGSSGVHNPFLAEALLRANIDELQAEYPGLPALRASVQTILDGPLGAITKRPLLRPLIVRPISSR